MNFELKYQPINNNLMNERRILIIADDPLARAGLAALLSNQPECVVVGQLAANADLAAEIPVYQPQALLWDLGWEPLAILDRLIDLKDNGLPIIALLRDETHATEAWNAGARGLLRRDTPAEQLATALVSVTQGLVVLDTNLAAAVLPIRERASLPPINVEELTAREREVLQRLAEGLPNKIIAQRLGISEHTVKFHINAILSKLGAQSRTDAVVRATRIGLIIL